MTAARLKDAIRPAAAAIVPLALRAAGRDVTASTARASCLVLAPHPDDETLGCGATIALKRRTGTAVDVLVATDGRHGGTHVDPEELAAVRRAETISACAVLGVARANVTMLDFADGDLAAAEDRLAGHICALIELRRPRQIYATSPTDPHPDHAAMGRAAVRAAAATSSELLLYPIWQWARVRPWLASAAAPVGGGTTTIRLGLRPRPVLVRTGELIGVKRAAIERHASQLDQDAPGADGFGLSRAFLRYFLRSHEVFFPVALPR